MEIKNLDLIELKDGSVHMATQNGDFMGFVGYPRGGNTEDTVENGEIVKIYRPKITNHYNNCWCLFIDYDKCKENFDLVYEKNEDIKEYTMEELQVILGEKFKLVK